MYIFIIIIFQLEKLGLSVKQASSREQLKPFCDTHATLKTVNKTGLGSSAALTTSLVGALFLYFNVFQDLQENNANLTWIHNVAQFVHCFAQGKVGSGFDVSAAVFGSHRYQRFNPSILTPIMVINLCIFIWQKKVKHEPFYSYPIFFHFLIFF